MQGFLVAVATALQLASFNRIQAQSSKFLAGEIDGHASAAERLEIFAQWHTRRLEYVTPFHRTAAMVDAVDPHVAAAMRKARKAAVHDLEKTLGPTLNSLSASEKQALLIKLHTVCALPSWEMLRMHYHLSAERARSIMTSAGLAILAAGLAKRPNNSISKG